MGPNSELMKVEDEHLEGRHVGLNLFKKLFLVLHLFILDNYPGWMSYCFLGIHPSPVGCHWPLGTSEFQC